MKRFLTILSVAVLATAVSCSQSNNGKENKKAAEITFTEKEHDFGTIEQNSNAEFAFIYQNTGKEPLIISNVQTSCGCTVPDWTRDPINKKKFGVVKVHYNTHAAGAFLKTINVYSNASNSPVTLKIKGTVVPKSEPEKK
jgi:hypothetical protein